MSDVKLNGAGGRGAERSGRHAKGRLSGRTRDIMGYIQDVERDLTALLEGVAAPQQRTVIRYVKEKVLESYRNGLDRTAAAGNRRDERKSEQKSGCIHDFRRGLSIFMCKW